MAEASSGSGRDASGNVEGFDVSVSVCPFTSGNKDRKDELAKRLYLCIHTSELEKFLKQTVRPYAIKDITYSPGEHEVIIVFNICDRDAWNAFKTHFHNDLSKNINAYLNKYNRKILLSFSGLWRDNSYVQYKISLSDKRKTMKQADQYFGSEIVEGNIEQQTTASDNPTGKAVKDTTKHALSPPNTRHGDSNQTAERGSIQPADRGSISGQGSEATYPRHPQDVTSIKLLVSVFIPDVETDKVESVVLKTNIDSMKNICLDRFPQSSLWSRNVLIPATVQGFDYRFTIRKKLETTTGFSMSTVKKESLFYDSELFRRKAEDSNRRLDVILCKTSCRIQQGYAEVCSSIISSVGEVSLKQAIMDMEHFQSQWAVKHVDLSQILDVVERQTSYFLPYKRDRALCFLVFLSVLPSGQHPFVTKLIPDIIRAVAASNLQELTSSCAGKVVHTLLHLYMNSEDTKKRSFLGFVSIAFPFAPASMLTSIYNNAWKPYCYPFSVDEMDESSVLVSIQSKSSKTPEDKALLEILLRNIELVSLVRYTNYQLEKNGKESDETKLSSSTLATRTKVEINKSCKANTEQFRRLLGTWEIVCSGPMYTEFHEVLSLFEKSVVRVIKSTDKYSHFVSWEDIVQVCIDHNVAIFTNFESQKDLIDAIATTLNKELCRSFITILNAEKFCHFDNDEGRKVIAKWFDNIISRHCKSHRAIYSHDLCEVYGQLGDLSRTKYVKMRQDMLCPLSEKVRNILKKRTMQDNFQTTSAIEKMNDPYAEAEFSNHMNMLIREGYDSRGYSVNQIIMAISGNTKVLRINSSVTLNLCVSLMKMSGVVDTSTLEETVMDLLKCSTLWKVVFDAEGSKKGQLTKDHLYKHSHIALCEIVKCIRNGTISTKLLSTPNVLKEMEMLLLCVCPSSDVKEIIGKVSSGVKEIQLLRKKMIEIHTSLELVCKKTGTTFKAEVEEVKTLTQSHIDSIESGIALKELVTCTEWVKEMHDEFSNISFLLESRLYWRAVHKCLGSNYDGWSDMLLEKHAHDTNQVDAVADIRWLFSSESKPCEDDESIPLAVVMSFATLLCGPVLDLYKKWWDDMSKLDETKISDVISHFPSPDKDEIQREIEHAKRTHITLGLPVKRALGHFTEYPQYENRFLAIKGVLSAFELDSSTDEHFHRAISAFDKLCEHDNQLMLKDVDDAIQILKEATKDIDDELIDIIEELVRSSSLVEFLREVVNEDLRNLIDAVEEHSEQFVSESTVSDLLDVNQFLYPVLKADFDQNIKAFIGAFTRSYKNCRVERVPAKIHMCMDNVHSLRSLYYNVANKEENTKEVIKMINTAGVFRIQVNKKPCELTVECKQEKKTYEYSRSRLGDLKSRALLIMSTEEKRYSGRKDTQRSKLTEHLSNFSLRVDILFAIVDKIDSLKALGHFSWSNSSMELVKPNEAKQVLDNLTTELSVWESLLQQCREKFHFMNYISSEHLPLVLSYLEKGNMSNTVLNILKFINPSVDLSHLLVLRENYKSMTMEDGVESKLNRTGHCIQAVFETMCPMGRTFSEKERGNVKLRDIVTEGKIHISVLEPGSRSVLYTVLALYKNTTGLLPEANQLLFCNKKTTPDEMTLLINKCLIQIDGQTKRRLFCIVNAELLPYELQFKLTSLLQSLPREQKYLLAIVCKGRDQCSFLEWFHDNISSIRPLTEIQLRECFESKWSNVITVTSDIPGQGKTETIHDIASQTRRGVKTLHLSGLFDKSKIVKQLLDLKLRPHHLLHIDIRLIDDPMALDLLLFQLIVTGFISEGPCAYAIPTTFICIEVANSISNTLLDSLSTAIHFKRRDLKWENYSNMKIPFDVNSPLQVICQYFDQLETSKVDSTDTYFHGNSKVTPLTRERCIYLLQKYFSSASDMSFTLVGVFANVLADQLKKMSASIFFRQSSINAILGDKGDHTLKSKLLKIMIDVSKEFATRSIGTCRSSQSAVLLDTRNENKNHELENTAGKLAQRVKGMIQWEESNHLVVIFHYDVQTVSALFRKISQVPANVKTLFQSQMKKDFDNLEKASVEDLQRIIVRFACKCAPQKKTLSSLAQSYALTPDNLLKMILVVMRLQSNVPVVIMGETGCGKTSLVKYLSTISGIELDILSIHAGTSEDEIVSRIESIQNTARDSLSIRRWVFLDEINTCDHLGIIADLLCHHRYLGKTLLPNISVIAACNPYRLRPKDAVYTEGLQGRIREDELSRLVYRVHPLPESLIDFVWDYGRLSDNDEQRYIRTMVGSVLDSHTLSETLAELLVMSQMFTRDLEHTDYSVSLRDVDRTIRLVKWFKAMLANKNKAYCGSEDIERKAVILAMAMSYQSRICKTSRRKDYVLKMASVFCQHHTSLKETDVTETIRNEQDDILNRMEIPEGIARNTALRENVFVMFVSILNRIPVFIVGKPGCSKSLSMQLIRSNLRGKDSKNDFFKTLPQLFCVSFQGSESSTSDGIVKVFEKAKRYQDRNTSDKVLSVVILDEIGLAEISRFNPLKVLHGLLEPEGKKHPDVAVVGISNWALDAAKMNRAIHLSRPEMDDEELYETAKSISQSLMPASQKSLMLWSFDESRFLKDDVLLTLKALAFAFNEYNMHQRFKNFHGLRDYYSLIKYISKCTVATKSEVMVTEKTDIITHGLLRNFGGLPSEMTSMTCIFQKHLKAKCEGSIPVLDLIKANVDDASCRHLMLITQGDAIIGKLGQLLKDCGKEYEVMFGSQFEDDLTDDYNYRILSRIILCMEQGIVLILKDLENIYGSLYDMLNQNYTVVGKKKNCRVALGPYSNPMCHVNDDFKCIVLVEETNLNFSDPPFLNRFEKQQFRFVDMISLEDKDAIVELQTTLHSFVDVSGRNFTVSKAIPIHDTDALFSLILNIKETTNAYNLEDIIRICLRRILSLVFPEAIVRSTRSVLSNEQPSKVQSLIDEYFELPLHEGLESFLISQHGMNSTDLEETRVDMNVIFTHSNMHVNINSLLNNQSLSVLKMGAFKSEKDLTKAIENFFESEHEFLFLQFDSRYDMQHFLLTKITIEQKAKENINKASDQLSRKYVYLLVHLSTSENIDPSTSQIHFMSGWNMVTIDTLEKPRKSMLDLRGRNLTEIISEMRPLHSVIKKQLLWAFTRIQYGHEDRHIEEFENAIGQLQTSTLLLEMVDDFVISQMKSLIEDGTDWESDIACDEQALVSAGSYIGAIENHILDIIRKPVAVFVFKMEQEGCLDSLFIDDSKSKDRQKMWENLAGKIDFCHFEDIPMPSGPECYTCTTPAMVRYVPFSYRIITQIEDRKDDFLYTLRKVKAKNKEYDDDDEHPIELVHAVLNVYKDVVTSNTQLNELDQVGYQGMTHDYFHDFCNHMTFSANDERAAVSLQWAINNTAPWESETFVDSVIQLHAIYWTYKNKIDCIGKILELACTSGPEERNIHDVISEISSTQNNPEFLEQECHVLDLIEELKECGDEHQENEIDTFPEIPDVMEQENEGENDLHVNHETEYITDVSDHTPESISEIDPIDKLVSYVGNMLIPTNQNMDAIDFEKWYQTVSRALPLIGQMYVDLSINHKLRFCSDLASILIVPYNLDVNRLTEIGNRLNQSELNEKETFSSVMNFLQVLKNQNSNIPSEKLKKVISLYIYRCIQAQSDSDDIFIWFLEWIKDEDQTESLLLPDFHFIGSILQLAVLSQQEEDDDPFSSLLAGEDDWQNNAFCKSLDNCLGSLSQKEKLLEGLTILLVEIIQSNEDTDEHEGDDAIAETLESALMMMSNESDFPLEQIARTALIRQTLDLAVGMIRSNDFSTGKNQSFLQRLDVLLGPLEGCEGQAQYGPLHYFLRKLGQDCGLREIQNLCEHLTHVIPAIKQIEWKKDLTTVCLEFNPLEFYCSEESAKKVEDACAKWMESKEKLKLFCDEIATDNGLILHIERILTAIFLKRVFVPIPDSAKKFVNILHQMLPVDSIPKEHAEVLPYLCGDRDFNHDIFHLSTETGEVDPYIVSVLLHLISITTLYGRPGHVFYDCMHNPSQLPSHPAERGKKIKGERETKRVTECPCRVIFVASTSICPLCKHHQLSPEDKEVPVLLNSFGRNLDYSPSNVLYRMLVNASLICSVALRYSNESTISTMVMPDDDECNAPTVLQSLVMSDWERLRRQLNLSHSDLGCLLNVFLCTKKDMILDLTIPSNTNSEKYLHLFTECCGDFLKNRMATLTEYRLKFASRRGIQNNIEHILMTENEFTLYGTKNNATVENLVAELSFIPASEGAFLRVVLGNRDILSLPKYITDILKWHFAVVNNMSYKVRKHKCSNLTVAEFLYMVDEDDSNAALKQKFNDFKNAWNILKENRSLLLEVSDSIPDMELMTMSSPAPICLIIDKNSVVYRVLEMLVSIQNNILIEAMHISRSKDHPDFTMLSCGHDAAAIRCVSVLNVTPSDIISFEWTDDFLRFSQCKPNSEHGRGRLYDFHKIEMEAAYELIFRKSFITNVESIPVMVFADELFKNSITLIHRVSDKITPQMPLTMELKRGIESKSKRNPSYTIQLLSQIGIVLSLLNKTGGKPDTSLIDYLTAWQCYVDSKAIRNLLPEPENALKLCHVVAIYEHMELKSGDEISGTLVSKLRSHLPSEIRQHFGTIHHQKPTLEIVDKALKLFVHRNFSTHDMDIELYRPLIHYLMDPIYWRRDINVIDGAIDIASDEAVALRRVLSPGCLGEHLYETMELIKQAIADEEASEMRISSASEFFKESRAPRKQPGKRKKATSKLIGKT
ncbi:uncharacterized protein [Argopecten irradians]|uniref:uncharacterized protein isoform X2 n=1 Tax=Argopecten irradians TaxID=31199 RepID=UPI00371CD7D6